MIQSLVFGRINNQGFPLISNYSVDEYNAANQNWAAVQDKRGLLYVANNSGVLEFDGQNWRLIKVGEDLSARSLAVDENNRIFVGALGDFGYLQPDSKGELLFTSLGIANKLPADAIGDVITTVATRAGIIFHSMEGIFLYRQNRLTVIKPETKFHLGFCVNGQFYIRQRSKGLYHLNGDRLEFISGSEMFAEDRVYTMLAYTADTILLGARDNGIYFFKPLAPPAQSFVKAQQFTGLEKELQGKKVGYCDQLKDGSLAIGTVQNGLYLYSREGRLIYHLDKAAGLLNDGIYYVYPDKRDNLVLCLSDGIAYVETGLPFRFITDKCGIKGSGSTANLFTPTSPASPSRLFLGTYQGLFYRAGPDANTPCRMLPGSQETWSIIEQKGALLVAHNNGIAQIVHDKLLPILQNRLVLSLLSPHHHPDMLLAGTFGTGLERLEFRNGQWLSSGSVRDFSQSAFNLSETPDGYFWLHTNAGNGIIRLTLSADLSRVTQTRTYTVKDGLPANSGNLVFPGKKRIYIATTQGVYRFDPASDRFKPDPDFPETWRSKHDIRIIHEDQNGNVWMLSSDFSALYRRQKDNTFTMEVGALARLKHFRTGEFVKILDRSNVIIGYKDGFIMLSPEASLARKNSFQALIRRVVCPGQELFAGTYMDQRHTQLFKQRLDTIPELPYRKNQLRFDFAAPFLEGASLTEFSYKLEGFDENWSNWSRLTNSNYTNLPEGHYTFLARARNVYDEISSLGAYAFVIRAPWYRTIPAYLGYILFASLLITAIVMLNSRRLLKEKKHLEALVAEKTQELKELSLSDPLTGLRNRRFITEIVVPEIEAFASFKRFELENNRRRSTDTYKSVFAVYLFDIDHFKTVNDTYGHEVGDRILKQLATILKSSIRPDDFTIRWGGEEFLVILKKTSLEYVGQFAQKIKDKVAQTPFTLMEDGLTTINKTVSIGYATFPFYEKQPEFLMLEQIIMLADLGLYYAKNHGRNLAVCVIPGDNLPPPEDLEKFSKSLEFSLEKGYIKISS